MLKIMLGNMKYLPATGVGAGRKKILDQDICFLLEVVPFNIKRNLITKFMHMQYTETAITGSFHPLSHTISSAYLIQGHGMAAGYPNCH